MRHPYEKLMRIEIIGIISALLLGIFSWATGWFLFFFIACYLLILSMLCNCLILLHIRRQTDALKQMIRAALLFLFITSLYFYS